MEQTPPSHLFTLRVWLEINENGDVRWRGKLRHIPTDTTYHFRDWAALVPILLSVLRQYSQPGDETQPEV